MRRLATSRARSIADDSTRIISPVIVRVLDRSHRASRAAARRMMTSSEGTVASHRGRIVASSRTSRLRGGDIRRANARASRVRARGHARRGRRGETRRQHRRRARASGRDDSTSRRRETRRGDAVRAIGPSTLPTTLPALSTSAMYRTPRGLVPSIVRVNQILRRHGCQ